MTWDMGYLDRCEPEKHGGRRHRRAKCTDVKPKRPTLAPRAALSDADAIAPASSARPGPGAERVATEAFAGSPDARGGYAEFSARDAAVLIRRQKNRNIRIPRNRQGIT